MAHQAIQAEILVLQTKIMGGNDEIDQILYLSHCRVAAIPNSEAQQLLG